MERRVRSMGTNRMMRIGTVLVVVAAALEAQDPSTSVKWADGAWQRLKQGAVEGTPGLRVVSQVRVLLRGNSQSSQISYRFIQRIHAHSAQAAAQAPAGDASIASSQGVTSITAQGRGASTTLEVYVPAAVRTTYVEVQGGGDINASSLRGELMAYTQAGDIEGDSIGGNVGAYTGGGHIQFGQVAGRLNCSTGAGSITVAGAAEVNCQTSGGEIVVKRSRGPVSLSSGGGNIQVEQADQNVDAHSMKGEIVVGRAGGVVTATTGAGAIRIGPAAGVRATSASGPVYLTAAAGAISVSTALGSILAALASGARFQNSSLVAASGDITVMIPSSIALSIMATNERGGVPHIDSEFSEIRVPQVNFVRPALAEGKINGGGPTLVLSGSDMIYLRRSK